MFIRYISSTTDDDLLEREGVIPANIFYNYFGLFALGFWLIGSAIALFLEARFQRNRWNDNISCDAIMVCTIASWYSVIALLIFFSSNGFWKYLKKDISRKN